MLRGILSLAMILCYTASLCRAQEHDTLRPVLSAYTMEIGSSHIADTYLSPLRHSGWNIALNYERMQAMRFDPERWVMDLEGRLALERTLNNPARNAPMWDIDFRLGWGMSRRFRLNQRWSIHAGGFTDIEAGAIYKPRNSNNPVAAKAAWTVGATASAVLNATVFKLPVCLRYRVSMPLTGVFFSPDYGELYYEIYLGNHSGLAHCAWPGNYFRLDNLLAADLRFGSTILRVGYSGRYFSSKSQGLVTRKSSHCLVLGVCSEWISLPSRKRNSETARIISALY